MDNTKYFATLTGKSFSSAAFERIEDYYNYLEISGRLSLYRRLLNAKNVGYARGGSILSGGDQDELSMIAVNHFSNILQHMKTITIVQRPAFEPRATNTDYKSKAQCLVARGILDYYNREKGMGKNVERATEGGLLFGETESVVEWDAMSGTDYMPSPDNSGKILKEGDIRFKSFGPIDCVRDVTLNHADQMKWRFYREFVNKFDLAAQFPEAENRILNLESESLTMVGKTLSNDPWKSGDMVPIYTFYHDKTPSVPNGRAAILIDKEAPLLEASLPYDFFPGFRLAPGEQEGTPFGSSVSFDLLSIQEAIDILYSTVITNQSSFGVQNILLPDGSNISVQQLVNGLNAIYFDPKGGKPESLNLTNTPPEIFNMIDRLERVMETLSGINSTTRGNPEASLKSGVALALVQSMAIQFNNGLQQSYVNQVENEGTAVIKILAKFPKTRRMVEIAGKSKRTYMKEFSPDDLMGISRVTVDIGNALSRTTAGKVQMADDLLKNKIITTTDQYIQVLTTGQIDPLIEGKNAELMLITSENEMLSEGKKPTVAVTDDHVLHIREHKVVLASPEAREDLSVVNAVISHETEHIRMIEQLSVSNPNLLIALGQMPVNSAPPATLPAPSGGNSAGVLDPMSPVVKEAGGIGLPQMPKNPLTGEQVEAPLSTGAV